MKTLIVISIIFVIAILAFADEDSKDFEQDILDVVKFTHPIELSELIDDYMINDPIVKAVEDYIIEHPKIEEIFGKFFKKPEAQELYTWILENVSEDFMNNLPKAINSDNGKHWSGKITGGWKGFVEDELKIVPIEEYRNLIAQKIDGNPIFAELVDKVKALKPVYDKFIEEPEIVELIEELKSVGYDFEASDNYIRLYTGWN